MLDPSAAKIAYTPMLGENGFSAQVNLAQASGSVMTFNYACRRTPNGDVETTRIAD